MADNAFQNGGFSLTSGSTDYAGPSDAFGVLSTTLTVPLPITLSTPRKPRKPVCSIPPKLRKTVLGKNT